MKYKYDIYRRFCNTPDEILATFYNPISAIKYVHSIRINRNAILDRDYAKMELARDGYTEIRNLVIIKENIKCNG